MILKRLLTRPWQPSQRLLFSASLGVILLVLAVSFVMSSSALYQRQVNLAEEEMLVKARLLATAHEQWLYEMENLMAAMVAGLDKHRSVTSECKEVFRDYLQLSLGIDTILLVAPDGDLLCASTPVSGKINFSDRSYYQRAMRTKKFAVGHFITGKVSRQRVLPMALPVLDERGEVAYLLVAGRTLEWVKNILTRQYLSEGHDMAVVDGDGTVLAYGPGEAIEPERPYPSPMLRKSILSSDSGVREIRLNGSEYIVGYTRLGSLASDVFVLVSQPSTRMLEPAREVIRANSVLFLLTILLVFAALIIGIGRWILLPLDRLATTMEAVQAGKSGIRVERMGPSRELSEIGDNFNEMLDVMEDSGKRWKRLADHDSLLGIANRRFLDEIVHTEWRRMARDHESLSLLMIDVDMFKRYNDYYGHKAGDECLKKVTAVLRGVLHRPADVVARYGGEEFVVLLPETDAAGATRIAEEIQETLAAQRIPHTNSPVTGQVTVSIGIACIVPSVDEHVDSLIEQADHALYRAKAAGRNRFELYS